LRTLKILNSVVNAVACEIGKALLDSKCNYKEWNGMSAKEYFDKARSMFQEMDLQYDLDDLDKITANI